MPSEKVFSNHQFLLYNSLYYDPSYGVTYTNPADFQAKAVQAFVSDVQQPFPGQLTLLVKKRTVTTEIIFSAF